MSGCVLFSFAKPSHRLSHSFLPFPPSISSLLSNKCKLNSFCGPPFFPFALSLTFLFNPLAKGKLGRETEKAKNVQPSESNRQTCQANVFSTYDHESESFLLDPLLPRPPHRGSFSPPSPFPFLSSPQFQIIPHLQTLEPPLLTKISFPQFMQRAASSAAAASSLSTRPSSTSSQNPPPSPSSSSPSSLHPSKRPKPSSSFAPNSATTTSFPANTAHSELQAIREALAAEEAKRSQALERQAAEAGHETKWVLSRGGDDVVMGGLVFEAGIKRWGGRGFGVRRMGYSEIDAASSEEDGDGEGKSYYAGDGYGIPRNSTSVASNMMGRRSFGKFNRELEVSLILSPSVSLPSCFFKRCLSMIWFRVDVFFFFSSFFSFEKQALEIFIPIL